MNIQDYNQAVDQFSDGLYRFALKSINDSDQSRDFVQDAFEKLWVKIRDSGKCKIVFIHNCLPRNCRSF